MKISSYYLNMRIKEKINKEKLLTERPNFVGKMPQPLTSRLQNEYFLNQSSQNTEKQPIPYVKRSEKQNNGIIMNNQSTMNEYSSHSVIKIDNYESRRFKTQQGYEPMMTKSRYMGPGEIVDSSGLQKSTSTEQIVLRGQKSRVPVDKVHESVDFADVDRPLSFGFARRTEPLKSSVEYQEDVRMKNQILNEINLRKSQETLYASKDYSSSGFGEIRRCRNHHNKKAKYRLISEQEVRDEAEVIYCSKCTINLLQQGFKVQQLKPNCQLSRKTSRTQFISQVNPMLRSMDNTSRLQEMCSFEHRLHQMEGRIGGCLQEAEARKQDLAALDAQIEQSEHAYGLMIQYLERTKLAVLKRLRDKRNERSNSLQRYQKEMSFQLQDVTEMKNQMKQIRNKFITMKESEFKFLINSFTNKIQHYAGQFKESPVQPVSLDDQINEIVIGLCEFCKNNAKNSNQVQSHFTCSVDVVEKDSRVSEDDFICKTLFPESSPVSHSQASNNFDSNSMEESPSFNQYKTNETISMYKSARQCEPYRY